MSTKMRAAQSVENNSSCPKSKEQKIRSGSKRRDGITDQSVDALLHVDDLEYRYSIIRPKNSSTKDQSSQVLKRDMIPALPSRHGSRADSVVPLHSQHSPARLRAERILSKTNEFYALFEDSDFSVLDQPNELEVKLRKDFRKPESQSHSMALNVWRANKVNPSPQTQMKTTHSDHFHSNSLLNSTPHRFSHLESLKFSFHHDELCEPSSSFKDSINQSNSKSGVAKESSTQVTAKSMHVSKLRLRNDQVSDAALHAAIMNDVVEALAQQPFQSQTNPYVSLLDIKFAADVSADAGSDGLSMSNSKMLAKISLQGPKSMDDTGERKKSTCKTAKRSKMVKVLQKNGRKNSPNMTSTASNDIHSELELPFDTNVGDSPSSVQSQKATTLPPLQPKVRTVEIQKSPHEPSTHTKTCEVKSQKSLSKADFELIGFTISSEESAERMVSRSELFEAIERNADERNEICFDIDRYCLKLQKQWQAKQKTMLLCLSNTRLQGSARSRLLAILRSLRQNQDDFFVLVQQYYFGSGSSGMSRKIAHWKQEIVHHMHELVKLPTVADVINEIATEGKDRSNSSKSTIGTFSGCAKVDLATAAACSKLLLGSKDSKCHQQNDAKFFHIFGNNVAPSNGQISSMMLSPNEPLEEYNKVGFQTFCFAMMHIHLGGYLYIASQRLLNGLPGVFVQAALTEGIAGSRVRGLLDTRHTHSHKKCSRVRAGHERTLDKCHGRPAFPLKDGASCSRM
jgi:hypothetical protein